MDGQLPEKRHRNVVDYREIALGKGNKGVRSVRKNSNKSKRKTKTPVRRAPQDPHHNVSTTNGEWAVTPSRAVRSHSGQGGVVTEAIVHEIIGSAGVTSAKSTVNAKSRRGKNLNLNNHAHNSHSSNVAVIMDTDEIEVNASEKGEFIESEGEGGKEASPSQAELQLRAEILEMEKKLEAKRMNILKRRKERLLKELEAADEEDLPDPPVQRKRKSKKGKVKVVKTKNVNVNNNVCLSEQGVDDSGDWDDSCEDDGSGQETQLGKELRVQPGELPPLDLVQSIFTDDEAKVTAKKSKQKFKLRNESNSEDDDESEDDTDDKLEGQIPAKKQKKGKKPIKSGIFAKASSTKLLKSVLHAQAMIDIDEVVDGKDIHFHDLSFNLLIAGEMEIVLSNISSAEKWTRLQILRRLAYKSQILEIDILRDAYAGFLRKIERGTYSWGSASAVREFDELLRFKAARQGSKQVETKMSLANTSSKSGGSRYSKKFYCLDYNRGKCPYPDSHEGTFNKKSVFKVHMCKNCWEKDSMERKHCENSSECPYKKV